jgi:hypothetical protein
MKNSTKYFCLSALTACGVFTSAGLCEGLEKGDKGKMPLGDNFAARFIRPDPAIIKGYVEKMRPFINAAGFLADSIPPPQIDDYNADLKNARAVIGAAVETHLADIRFAADPALRSACQSATLQISFRLYRGFIIRIGGVSAVEMPIDFAKSVSPEYRNMKFDGFYTMTWAPRARGAPNTYDLNEYKLEADPHEGPYPEQKEAQTLLPACWNAAKAVLAGIDRNRLIIELPRQLPSVFSDGSVPVRIPKHTP